MSNHSKLYDVFISYNSQDKSAVEFIAQKLEKENLTVWLDRWNLVPGDPWQEELEIALDENRGQASSASSAVTWRLLLLPCFRLFL